MMINEDRCVVMGLDPKKVASIARRISKVALEAQTMGLTIFGGSGTGTLRHWGEHGQEAEVADLDGMFDGGDGGD